MSSSVFTNARKSFVWTWQNKRSEFFFGFVALLALGNLAAQQSGYFRREVVKKQIEPLEVKRKW